MKKKPKFKHYLEAGLIWLLPILLRPLPFGMRVRVGGFLIGGALRLVPQTRKRISKNLDLVYPEMKATEKRQLMKNVSRNIGRRFIEVFYAGEFQNQMNLFHVTEGSIDQAVEAKEKDQPVIFISAHFGHWEAPRAVLKSSGMEIGAIYRESSNPIFEKRFINQTEIGGKPLLMAGPKGARAMFKHLRSGGMFAILLDQADLKGDKLEFMGLPAYTSTSAAELALKFNALLIPTYGIFRPNGRDIDIVFEPAIEHSDPITMTQQLNDSLTARVRKNPEQWYWLHRRWKLRDTD